MTAGTLGLLTATAVSAVVVAASAATSPTPAGFDIVSLHWGPPALPR
ncbi:MAG: hypothetical protein ABR521_03460 [Gaiellaceae bacterium]